MTPLAKVTAATRKALDATPEELIAAVPTVARGSLRQLGVSHGTTSSGILLHATGGAGAAGVFLAGGMMLSRYQTRNGTAYQRGHGYHLLIIIRPERVDIHQLKGTNRPGKYIESHPLTDVYYETISGDLPIDTLLTIGDGEYHVRTQYGSDLRETLAERGLQPGITKDI